MDDTAHIRKNNLKVSEEFTDFLTVKLSWSKNVSTEFDCPNQIVVGSMEPLGCVYLHLALWLEPWCRHFNGKTSQWLFCQGCTTKDSPIRDQDKEAKKGKEGYSRTIKKAVERDDFVPHQEDGKLGSHSIRKLAVSYARKCEAPTDDIDYRARWKSRKKPMQDRYTDILLPWPDINCATKLCLGGAVKYKLRPEAGVTDRWLANNITPSIMSAWNGDHKIASILAKPLLWACYDPEYSNFVHADVRFRCIERFHNFNRDVPIPEGVNPVEKIPLFAEQGKESR
jgi:hypothetical protein